MSFPECLEESLAVDDVGRYLEIEGHLLEGPFELCAVGEEYCKSLSDVAVSSKWPRHPRQWPLLALSFGSKQWRLSL